MSQDIINEVYFLMSSIAMGIVITFVYDFILIGRRVIKHTSLFVSVEDFIFWTACALAVFYMLYKENNGILRWFAVFGATVGMLLYKKIVGIHFVKLVSTVIQKELHIIRKIFGVIFSPLKWLIKKAERFFRITSKKERKVIKYMKKKLTAFRKVLKITLCKH